jgi:hypothetical protein
MCDWCIIYNTCVVCDRSSSEVELTYRQDIHATAISGTDVGSWLCDECVD